MENKILKDVYRILRTLEKAADLSEFTLSDMNAEEMGMTEGRWANCLTMLAERKYIEGVSIYKNVMGEIRVKETTGIRITLDGLEYLQTNGTMQKLYRAERGIVEIIP